MGHIDSVEASERLEGPTEIESFPSRTLETLLARAL